MLPEEKPVEMKDWEENVEYLLSKCPFTVRQRPGGGPEVLLHTLIVTFLDMQGRLKELGVTKR